MAKTVIWDVDGVIVDSAHYHFGSWQEVFKNRGISYNEEDFKKTFGQRNDAIIRTILGESVSQKEINSVATEKEKSFRRRIRRNVKSLPGVIELMKALSEGGFIIALASSTPRENVDLIIKNIGIDKYFQSIVADEDVTEGKPSPQVFLLAAKRLGVEPRDCVVIEDSVAGVTGAKRAGMSCLAVTNTHPRISLTGADLIVDTLKTVTADDLERLINSQSDGGEA
ncbi:HAD family hydrolase [Chloroflexota bacterium]